MIGGKGREPPSEQVSRPYQQDGPILRQQEQHQEEESVVALEAILSILILKKQNRQLSKLSIV
jgi:hypothetical protein